MTDTNDETSWSCPGCAESVPHTFRVCWQCGTSRDGKPDPSFVPVNTSSQADPPNARPRTMGFYVATATWLPVFLFFALEELIFPDWHAREFLVMLGLMLPLIVVAVALISWRRRRERRVEP